MKFISLIFVLFAAMSCDFTHNDFQTQNVMKIASFEHNCPLSQISLIEENSSLEMYKLNVCGVIRKYRRINSVYYSFVEVKE